MQAREHFTDQFIEAIRVAFEQRKSFGKDSDQYRAAAALCERLNRQIERQSAPLEAA